jgi:hypothetical protein
MFIQFRRVSNFTKIRRTEECRRLDQRRLAENATKGNIVREEGKRAEKLMKLS